ncbi:MAG TPA: type II secretion system secretin GspD [Polyangia bacterium]|jgi:general secretion pathway protein D
MRISQPCTWTVLLLALTPSLAAAQPRITRPEARPPAPAAAPPTEPARTTALAGEREFNSCRKVAASKRIKVTLKPESELTDLVGWISAMTCKRFILGAGVRSQKVTVVSPEPLTAAEGYRLFSAVLATMGLTVEATGQFLRIIETGNAKGANVPTCRAGDDCVQGDTFVTRLIKLRHAGADEVMGVLTRLKSKDADIVAYGPAGTLIITEWAANLSRLVAIADELDVAPVSQKVFTIKLKHAAASDVAARLQDIFEVSAPGARGPGAPPPPPRPRPGGAGRPALTPAALGEPATDGPLTRILPDDRTRTLIIVGGERAFERARAIVYKVLDLPAERGRQGVHVYPLANAMAEEMAAALTSLAAGSGYRGGGGGGGGGPAGARPAAGLAGARPGPMASPPAPGGGAAAAGPIFEAAVTVSGDKPTNSLVITATTDDFLKMKEVIAQLDRPRRQVFIEAAILEVSLDRTRDLGVAFHGGKTVGGQSDGVLFGGVNAMSSLALSPAALSGLAVGLRGSPIANGPALLGLGGSGDQPGLSSIPSFGVFLQALQTDSDVNTLSLPHILTADNEKAELTVGQTVPTPGALPLTGASAAYPGLVPTVPVQRQDVMLRLTVQPHVSEGDFVRIELDAELSDLGAKDPVLGYATTKKTAKAVIVGHDAQTVVIGGLMTEKTSVAETKIPFLGDLPLLGLLFKTRSTATRKTNLLIFLTPHIIRDQSDLKRIYDRKERERRDFLERSSSFRDPEILRQAHYRTGRGLLEAMNRMARDAEQEQRRRDAAEQQLQRAPEGDGAVVDLTPGAEERRGR